MPYRVKLAEIEQLFGTSDQELTSRTRNAVQTRLKQLDNSFGDISSEEILSDIIHGSINHPNAGYLYWYVIEALIRNSGTFLSNDQWYPVRNQEVRSATGARMYLFRVKPEIPWPDDFPMVFTVLHDNLDNAMAGMRSSSHDPEQIAQFEDWCTKAKSAGQDLVMYYY